MQNKNELTQWQADKLYHWLKRWDDLGPHMQAIYERTPVDAPYFDGHWFDHGGTWGLLDGEWLTFPRAAAHHDATGLEFGVALDNDQYVEQWNIQCRALLNGKTELVRGLPSALQTFPTLAACLEKHFLHCPIKCDTQKAELIKRYWNAEQAKDSCDFSTFLFAHPFVAWHDHVFAEVTGRVYSMMSVLYSIERMLRNRGVLTYDVLRDLLIYECNSEFCRSHNQLDRDSAASETNKRLQTNFVNTVLRAFLDCSVLTARNNQVSLNKVPHQPAISMHIR
jgi:hypothetical protein